MLAPAQEDRDLGPGDLAGRAIDERVSATAGGDAAPVQGVDVGSRPEGQRHVCEERLVQREVDPGRDGVVGHDDRRAQGRRAARLALPTLPELVDPGVSDRGTPGE